MNGIVLDVGQIYLIGLVATLAAQVVKIVAKKSGNDISKLGITMVAFGVSLVLSAVWFAPDLPVFADDPMAFATALLSAATAILGAASGIYNVFLEKFLGFLGRTFNIMLEP